VIGLVDHGAGNLASVANALDRLEVAWRPVQDAGDLEGVAAAILPGVGAAGAAMASLRAAGLDDGLRRFCASGRPYLGICVGLQLLFERSAEDGAAGLGILAGEVVRIPTAAKLPHVGWNTIELVGGGEWLRPFDGAAFYFTHSYVVAPTDPAVVAAVTDHGTQFVSAVEQGSIFGVQFHPERSGPRGLELLAAFCRLAGPVAVARAH